MRKISRRDFGKTAAALPLMSFQNANGSEYQGGLTDIPGIEVGHFTDKRRPTGCTVVLIPKGAVAGVDVRGSAPGTRETDLLNPVHSIQKVHAVLLSGGSAFGLSAASGVVRYLEENDIGYQTSVARVPIVPAAILFDLGLGDASIRPDEEAGYQSCQNAGSGKVSEGNVGAGAGATVGKMFGMERAMKSGLGSASLKVNRLTVAALAAVNAIGDVINPASGEILAGARTRDGRRLVDTSKELQSRLLSIPDRKVENTTLAVVATNASLGKAQITKVAQMAHDGLARSINPAHLPMDGDTIFALSAGQEREAHLAQVGSLAAEAVSRAIQRAVIQARSLPGLPARSDLEDE